jgi:hypothetical protein
MLKCHRIQQPFKMLSAPRDLRKTLNKYLRSLEPFLLEDELRGGMSFNSG